LEVLVIPTNKPVIRVDKEDKVFFNQEAKFKNIVDTVKFYHKI
jgi:preprotein translocase subunit SecA